MSIVGRTNNDEWVASRGRKGFRIGGTKGCKPALRGRALGKKMRELQGSQCGLPRHAGATRSVGEKETPGNNKHSWAFSIRKINGEKKKGAKSKEQRPGKGEG